MSIAVTLQNIVSGYNISKINANFQALKTAIQDGLSISGNSPNQMLADIDLNSNDLLNAGLITATNLTVGGIAIAPGTLAVGPQGSSGWSPVFAIVTDSARRVLQLVSYIGGGGTPPITYLNYYVGATGMTNVLANGVDIRGPTGPGTGDMLKATYDGASINEQLVGLTATQSLSNKSLKDTTSSVVNTSDTTKKLVFDVSPITTATTRTIKWADKSGTSALTSDIPGLLWGCTLSNDVGTPASKIAISAGFALDSTNTEKMTVNAIVKSLASTWAVGTGNGGLDTGAVADGTYHVFVIKRLDTGVVDVLFSLSATAPTMPTNYTVFRRIGSIKRSGGAIVLFVQDGDNFYWNVVTPANDLSSTGSLAKSAFTANVPTGIRVLAHLQIFLQTDGSTGGCFIYIFDGVNTNINKWIHGQGNYYASSNGNDLSQYTNTSAQLQCQITTGTGASTRVSTIGWTDTRGRI